MSQYPLARLPGLVALIFLVLFSLPDVFIHLVEAGVNTYSLNQTYFYTDSVQCSNSSVFAVSFSKPNNSTQKCVPTTTCAAVSTRLDAEPTPIGEVQSCLQLPATGYDYETFYYSAALQAFNGNSKIVLIAFYNDSSCIVPNAAGVSLPGVCVKNVPGELFNYYVSVDDTNLATLNACGYDPTCNPDNCVGLQSISVSQNNTCIPYSALGYSGYVQTVFKAVPTASPSSTTTTTLSSSSATTTGGIAPNSKGGAGRSINPSTSLPAIACSSISVLISVLLFL